MPVQAGERPRSRRGEVVRASSYGLYGPTYVTLAPCGAIEWGAHEQACVECHRIDDRVLRCGGRCGKPWCNEERYHEVGERVRSILRAAFAAAGRGRG